MEMMQLQELKLWRFWVQSTKRILTWPMCILSIYRKVRSMASKREKFFKSWVKTLPFWDEISFMMCQLWKLSELNCSKRFLCSNSWNTITTVKLDSVGLSFHSPLRTTSNFGLSSNWQAIKGSNIWATPLCTATFELRL